MSSEVDPTFPADNVPVDKALLRAQFETISNEISALQLATLYAWKLATGDQTMDTI